MSKQWAVPIISQRSLYLCWEASGRMLWEWYFRSNATQRNKYAQRAGNYATMNQGLTEPQMDVYYKRLGIRGLKNARGKNVRHALKWTPVIVTSVDQTTGHAMVVSGHRNGKYTVINPCAQQVVDFENPNADRCTAGTLEIPEAQIDGKLGGYIWYW